MSLRYVKGSYIDEILVSGNPVLVVLEGLEEGKEKEARRYGKSVWEWILAHRPRVAAHAPLIAKFKNEHWLNDGEPEMTAGQIRASLERINSVYMTYNGDFDVFFATNEIFDNRAVVITMSKDFQFKQLRLL